MYAKFLYGSNAHRVEDDKYDETEWSISSEEKVLLGVFFLFLVPEHVVGDVGCDTEPGCWQFN